jgi:large subunit ribosomal protein L2
MALKKFKPVTAGTRWRIGNAYAEVTTNVPEKSLVETKKRTGGRNTSGHMTMRYIGGGHRRSRAHRRHVPRRQAARDAFPQGRQVFAGLMKAGDKQIVTAEKQIALSVGDAGALAYTLNGRSGKSLGAAGKSVRTRITLANLQEFQTP